MRLTLFLASALIAVSQAVNLGAGSRGTAGETIWRTAVDIASERPDNTPDGRKRQWERCTEAVNSIADEHLLPL